MGTFEFYISTSLTYEKLNLVRIDFNCKLTLAVISYHTPYAYIQEFVVFWHFGIGICQSIVLRGSVCTVITIVVLRGSLWELFRSNMRNKG